MRVVAILPLSLVSLTPLIATASLALTWSTPARVTNAAGLSWTEPDGGRNAVAYAESLWVVWADARDGNLEIYVRARAGSTWAASTRLTVDGGTSRHPAIGRTDAGQLRVVWEDDRSGRPEIWTKRRLSGGSWSADSCLTCDGFASLQPSLNVGGRHLAWEETKDGNPEIYYRQWNDEGSWDAEFRVSNDPSASLDPSVDGPSGVTFNPASGFPDPVLVAWQDLRDGNPEIYARLFDSNSWGAETRITNDPALSQAPSATAEWASCGDVIFPQHWVAWQDRATGNDEIWLAEGGQGFWDIGPYPVSNTPGLSTHPSMTILYTVQQIIFGAGFCPSPLIAWEERAGITQPGEVYVLDMSTSAVAVPVSGTGAVAFAPSLIGWHGFPNEPNGGKVYEVVWTDDRHGNSEIYQSRAAEEFETGAPPSLPADAPFRVGAARPNPFQGDTRVPVSLDRDGPLSVDVHDAAGRLVRTLFRGRVEAGERSFSWDGRDSRGTAVASGAYFVSVRVGGDRKVTKVVRMP